MNSIAPTSHSQQPLQTVPIPPEAPILPMIPVDPYSPTAVILALAVVLRAMKQK